jgi:hypothetical protein
MAFKDRITDRPQRQEPVEELSPIDQILTPDNTDNVVLTNPEDGTKIEFEQVALVPVNEEAYVLLKPVEKFEGIGDDEAVAFQIFEDESGEFFLNEVEDEETQGLIFQEYLKLWEERNNNR